MKRFRILFVSALFIFFAWPAVSAELRLARIFSDRMVLQRETSAPVWGRARSNSAVTVKTSWNGASVTVRSDADGKWKAFVETGAAGGPYTLSVSCGKEKIEVQDIMLGEVWVCSGQSNMEMPLRGFGFQEVEGAREAILSAPETASQVRVFDIRTPKCTQEQEDVDARWNYTTSAVAAETSAVGYFFARRLSATLGVAVGIIVNPWGGSRIEPWMTRKAIEDAGITAEEMAAIDAIEEKPDRWPETPELIWNGRMAPVAGYAAKGFLWYQGCSNIGQECYDKLQASMVRLWRERWGRGDIPFIFALLAPYSHGNSDGRWRPHFVEVQLRSLNLIPNSYAVCTETLGSEVTVHPSKKKEVADMMYMQALQCAYSINPGISIALPTLKAALFGADGKVKITLSEVWSDLGSVASRKVTGFELAGEDRVFYSAEAEIDESGNAVLVQCPQVQSPVAVRYAFRNWMGANLQKTLGIPVPPFRTDDWPWWE